MILSKHYSDITQVTDATLLWTALIQWQHVTPQQLQTVAHPSLETGLERERFELKLLSVFLTNDFFI